eukprot:10459447-Alexandrium_andersonii.AAC.1
MSLLEAQAQHAAMLRIITLCACANDVRNSKVLRPWEARRECVHPPAPTRAEASRKRASSSSNTWPWQHQ